MDEYLNRVIFYEERPFSREEFRAYMLSQSKPLPRYDCLHSGAQGQISPQNRGRQQ